MATLPTRLVAKHDPILRFFLLAAALFTGWYLLHEFVVHPDGRLDRALIDNLAWLAGGMLQLLGYELLPDPAFDSNRYLGVQGGHHLWIGDACNGLSVFAVFLVFLTAFPGPLKHKLWFGALGLLTIHLINALRIAILCIIVSIDYELLNFNHDYTFHVVVYGWVFGLWYFWVTRLAPTPAPVHQ
jgi:exosortase family protein XrtF